MFCVPLLLGQVDLFTASKKIVFASTWQRNI